MEVQGSEKHKTKVREGKTSKAQGNAFELRVRADLEEKGWIVDKWTNQVEDGKLVKAKPKFRFDFKTKMRIPVSTNSGFPDFIAFQNHVNEKREAVFGIINECDPLGNDSKLRLASIIGVESKLTGYLDKAEKEKCVWLLNQKIFSKILIARKTKVKNRIVIVYEDFKEKYWRFYE